MSNLIEISLRATYASQQCFNVFHYQASANVDVPADGVTLSSVFASAVVDTIIAPMVSSLALFDLLKVRDVISGQTYVTLLAIPGERSSSLGASLPPFVAYQFRLNGASTITRPGQKRMVGVTEDFSQQTISYAPGGDPPLDAFVDFLSEGFDALIGPVHFTPVIVGRTEGVLDPGKVNPVVSATFVGFTTQNSRKVGRGI